MNTKNLANNQVVVIEDNGKETFFSYGTVIATKQNGVITLDENIGIIVKQRPSI